MRKRKRERKIVGDRAIEIWRDIEKETELEEEIERESRLI